MNVSLIETLSLAMIVTSLVAVETGNLKRAATAYGVQALLICGLILAFAQENHLLYMWAAVALATKAIITPWLLWHYVRRTGEEEARAIVGFGPSVLLASLLLIASYSLTHRYVHFLAPTPEAAEGVYRTNLAVSMTVFALGLYAILSRRDAIKTVIGLCLLENAVHLSLVSLAATLPETALVGVATEAVITVALLLYIIAAIHKETGTTDTFTLSELHW